jgi:NADH-quinone oxidoreductase subunit N
MSITLTDLIPLLPLLIATATTVVAMTAVGIKRSYTLTAGITIAGLLIASLVAASMMSTTNSQVTPLLIIDQYSLFFTVITCATAMLIAIFSFPYLATLDDAKEEYYLLLGIATIGAIVMVSSNHFVSTILGLETLSMSLYGMVAYPVHSKKSDKFPLEASVKYLVLSAAASGILLFGMALIYAQTGTLEFSSIVNVATDTPGLGEGFSIAALVMVFIGIAFKLSLAPFHMWTPDVYEGSPLPATTYLATIGKAAMFVVLLRLIEATEALSFGSIISVISLVATASILAGNLLALLQNSIKRILAYSSIAHMGYLLIALVASYYVQGTISVEAVTFYLVAYMIMSAGAFGVVSVVSSSEKEFDDISYYQGLFWRNPWLALVFTGMLLSLAGIPLTVGFIGKFYLFFAGVEAGLWVLLAVLILGSGVGLYYYLRIVYCMLLSPEEGKGFESAQSQHMSSHAVLAFLLVLLLVLGVYPTPLVSLIETASTYIL